MKGQVFDLRKQITIAVILLVVNNLAFTANAYALTVYPDGYIRIAQTAAADGSFYLLLENQTSSSDSGYGVLFVRSTDAGQTFGKTIVLDSNAGSQPLSQMVVSGNTIYIIWNSGTDCFEGRSKTMFAKSIDNGASFSKPIVVSDCKVDASAQLAASDNDIFISWNGLSYPSSDFTATDVFFTSSNDGGNTFGKPVVLSNSTGDSLQPELTSASNANQTGEYVSWIEHNELNSKNKLPEYQIYLAQVFANNTISFVNAVANFSITDAPSAWRIASSRGQDGQNNAYVVWIGAETRETKDDTRISATPIYLIKSIDGGHTFGNKTDVSSKMPGYSNGQIKLMAAGNQVFAIWQTNDSQLSPTFVAWSNDSGSSFSVNVLPIEKGYISLSEQEFAISSLPVSINTTISRDSTTNQALYLAWHYGSLPGTGAYVPGSTSGILFDKSPHDIAFGIPMELASYSNVKSDPVVAAFGNIVYVAWTEYMSDKPSIELRKSTDYGSTFSNTVTLSLESLSIPEFSPAALSVIIAAAVLSMVVTRIRCMR